ncbi:NUDIX hydrolase [Terasakiella sp. A23]|uniref:NUDIX hydrolase n=1 Tax=Terasakiella sp. FCG-A23 TaxID=3080561 RepID=UPI0029555413|nr:NUDIX hydrolase [Terasakiella sp. A23]MDV7341157.1 NUDIX hydrolase [Terasakiella sp. A23]
MNNTKLNGPSIKKIPDGDDRERLVCPDCGFIDYQNPRIVVGAVCTWEDKFLLCRRAIEPSLGKWTFPAGFMELNETVAEGAAREAYEEAGVDVEIQDIIGVYEVPEVGHVMMMHRAPMKSPHFEAGTESLEVALFDWDDIPWDDLAFPSVKWTLKRFHEVREQEIVPAVTERAKFKVF